VPVEFPTEDAAQDARRRHERENLPLKRGHRAGRERLKDARRLGAQDDEQELRAASFCGMEKSR
jgi:hypothetical protein